MFLNYTKYVWQKNLGPAFSEWETSNIRMLIRQHPNNTISNSHSKIAQQTPDSVIPNNTPTTVPKLTGTVYTYIFPNSIRNYRIRTCAYRCENLLLLANNA